MRSRRFLLVTTALSSATLMAAACGKESGPPGNPKGSAYDSGPVALPANPKGSQYDDAQNNNKVPIATAEDAGANSTTDASTTQPKPNANDAGPIIPRLPANPKGTHYDAGKPKKPTGP